MAKASSGAPSLPPPPACRLQRVCSALTAPGDDTSGCAKCTRGGTRPGSGDAGGDSSAGAARRGRVAGMEAGCGSRERGGFANVVLLKATVFGGLAAPGHMAVEEAAGFSVDMTQLHSFGKPACQRAPILIDKSAADD